MQRPTRTGVGSGLSAARRGSWQFCHATGTLALRAHCGSELQVAAVTRRKIDTLLRARALAAGTPLRPLALCFQLRVARSLRLRLAMPAGGSGIMVKRATSTSTWARPAFHSPHSGGVPHPPGAVTARQVLVSHVSWYTGELKLLAINLLQDCVEAGNSYQGVSGSITEESRSGTRMGVSGVPDLYIRLGLGESGGPSVHTSQAPLRLGTQGTAGTSGTSGIRIRDGSIRFPLLDPL